MMTLAEMIENEHCTQCEKIRIESEQEELYYGTILELLNSESSLLYVQVCDYYFQVGIG